MSYVLQSTNNTPWYRKLPERNRTSLWIIRNKIKEPKSVQKEMESISSPQKTGRCNNIHVKMFRKNIQENISIFNQIRHIQAIEEKLIILPTNYPTTDHISDVFTITLWDE